MQYGPRARQFAALELSVALAVGAILGCVLVAACKNQQPVSSEALSMLQSMRGAQENYRAENGAYAGCTKDGLDLRHAPIGDDDLFPRPRRELDAKKVRFDDPARLATPLGMCFRLFGVRADGPVRFTYGMSGDADSYELVAYGDPDGDGQTTMIQSFSSNNEFLVDGKPLR